MAFFVPQSASLVNQSRLKFGAKPFMFFGFSVFGFSVFGFCCFRQNSIRKLSPVERKNRLPAKPVSEAFSNQVRGKNINFFRGHETKKM